MLKLFLSSHGHMASGMKDSIEFFCGQNNNLTVFDAYVDEKNISEQLDAFYETVEEDDQVILCLLYTSIQKVEELYQIHSKNRNNLIDLWGING